MTADGPTTPALGRGNGMALWLLPVALAAGLLGVGPVLAPVSCEGGGDTYFWLGVAAAAVAGVSPLLSPSRTVWSRVGLSAGGVVLIIVSWVGGFALWDFRLLCRLW